MEIGILALLGILIVLVLFFFVQSTRQWREMRATKEKDPAFLLLQQQIDGLRDQVGRSLDGNVQLMHQQLSSLSSQVTSQLNSIASQVSEQVGTGMGLVQKASQHFGDRVQEVQSRLAQLDEANKRILEVGRSIASLQEILRAPKIRGGLGEFLLGDLLAQIMPAEYFTLQHSFKSGERVDAVIRLSQGLVPVDAKFPLENFQKGLLAEDDGAKKSFLKLFAADVKKHVEAIASKYILPHEGTCDFALMYIPAENVYYEAFIKDEALGEGKSLREYAFVKHVVPVSPNSFYAYLHTILLGLRGMKVEESARQILRDLGGLRGQLDKFQEEFRKLGKHLEQSKGSYDSSQRQLEKFSDKLAAVETPPLIQSPEETSNKTPNA
ncbi:MAG: DNA recombination protein RmuC [Deltaproteobacteria bacterium]|jgi:DNA recombination protein RmuC|nr:DNA recombination protein RmuC [Deltaproteobacteria bacterium]MDO9210709.1 DNA recombination protein RmuC [Deltaproteobacteria bacterium]